MMFQKISLVALSLLSFPSLAEKSVEREIESIYMDYVSDLNNKDFESVASYFQTPIMVRLSEQSFVLETSELIKDFFKNQLQKMQQIFRDTRVDKIEVEKATESIYYAKVNFLRYNDEGNILSSDSVVYFFNNKGGSWQIFYIENQSGSM